MENTNTGEDAGEEVLAAKLGRVCNTDHHKRSKLIL